MSTLTFDTNRLYTTKEVSDIIGIPTPTIHGWISRGWIQPTGKSGKNLTFDAATCERIAELRAAKGKPAPATMTVPTMPSMVSALALVKAAETASADGHRYWATGTLGGAPTGDLTFGPIALPAIEDNTADGQSHVPAADPNFSFDSGEAVVLANALDKAEPTWIYGPSGSGKTSGIKQMASLTNWPLYRINMHADVSSADFVGTTEVVIDKETGNAVTQFVDGVLIQAMLNGGILLIDEVTATPAHILLVLQAVLERADNPHGLWADGKTHCTFVNSANGGETIHAHPRFRIIVTDNTNGQGDVTGAFAGTNVMNEATRSRFTQWLHKDYPAEGAWRKMLKAKCGIDAETAKAIVGIAVDVNKGSAQLGSTTVTSNMVINPRDTLAVARLAKTFGDVGIAFKVGVVNSMNPTDPDRQFIVDLIKAKLTGK